MSGSGDDSAKREWLQRVLGIEIASSDNVDAELRKQLLLRVRETLLLAVNLTPEDKILLAKQAGEAKILAEGEDLLAAEVAVEQLVAFYDKAVGRARVEEAETVGKGRVSYRKLQLAWRQAQDGARNDLERLAQSVTSDPEVMEDELFADVLDAAGDIASLLPEFGTDLDEALDALEREGDPEASAGLRQDALSIIKDYRSRLGAADALAAMQDFADEEYGGLASITRLSDALSELSENIKSAL